MTKLGEVIAQYKCLELLEGALKKFYLKTIICRVYNNSKNKVDDVPSLEEGPAFLENLIKILNARGDMERSQARTIDAYIALIDEVDAGKPNITLPDALDSKNLALIEEDYNKFKGLNFHHSVAQMLVSCGWSLDYAATVGYSIETISLRPMNPKIIEEMKEFIVRGKQIRSFYPTEESEKLPSGVRQVPDISVQLSKLVTSEDKPKCGAVEWTSAQDFFEEEYEKLEVLRHGGKPLEADRVRQEKTKNCKMSFLPNSYKTACKCKIDGCNNYYYRSGATGSWYSRNKLYSDTPIIGEGIIDNAGFICPIHARERGGMVQSMGIDWSMADQQVVGGRNTVNKIRKKKRRNNTRKNKTRKNKTRINKTSKNKTRRNKTLKNKTRRNKTRRNKTRRNKTIKRGGMLRKAVSGVASVASAIGTGIWKIGGFLLRVILGVLALLIIVVGCEFLLIGQMVLFAEEDADETCSDALYNVVSFIFKWGESQVLFEERRFVSMWAKNAGWSSETGSLPWSAQATSASKDAVTSDVIAAVVSAYAGRAATASEEAACGAVLTEMLADSDAAVDGVVYPYRALRYLKKHSTNALYTALARVPPASR